jgi:hypothetical protein
MNKIKGYEVLIAGLVLLAGAPMAIAANVSLTGIDPLNQSSFNTAGLWSNASAPSAGNDYFVGNATRLRTPPDGSSYTFAGDSLTIDNTTAYGDGFMYKGTGSTGIITVGNLVMDGGLMSHANGVGDVFNVDGAMTVGTGGARIYAKQGAIRIYSDISGSGVLTNLLPDNNNAAQKLWIHSSSNTFDGNIINNGRLELFDDANLNFTIGASGVNNGISNGSAGTQLHTIFSGDFVFDLTGAGTDIGDSWALVTTVPASTYYTSTFTVSGFSDQLDGTWYLNNGTAEYLFDTSSGALSVVPEPSAALLGGLGLLCLLFRRRFCVEE